jgi:hypothetical protein
MHKVLQFQGGWLVDSPSGGGDGGASEAQRMEVEAAGEGDVVVEEVMDEAVVEPAENASVGVGTVAARAEAARVRRTERAELRRRCIPTLCFLLHRLFIENKQPKEAYVSSVLFIVSAPLSCLFLMIGGRCRLDLAMLVADDHYRLYEALFLFSFLYNFLFLTISSVYVSGRCFRARSSSGCCCGSERALSSCCPKATRSAICNCHFAVLSSTTTI